MENHKYNPDRIRHVEGQDGPVPENAMDKAMVMAEIEDDYQTSAMMYEAYLKKPETYLEQYPLMDWTVERYIGLHHEIQEARMDPDNLDKLRETGVKLIEVICSAEAVKKYLANPEGYLREPPTSNGILEAFVRLERKGISADYIRKIGEVAAETQGFIEDYAAAGYSDKKELIRDTRQARLQLWLHLADAALIDVQEESHVSEYEHVPEFYNVRSKVEIAKAIRKITQDTLRPQVEHKDGDTAVSDLPIPRE